MEIIEVYNSSFSYGKNKIFDNISLTIEKGSITNIIGKNSVGKTTLVKLLSGNLITDNEIKIEKLKINKFNMDVINRKIAILSSYNEFFSKTVIDEILQDKMNITQIDINKVKKLLNEFNLSYVINTSPLNLTYAENQIVGIIKAIIKEPKIIFLDNAFSKFDEDKKRELMLFLKEYSKEKNITLIYTSNNLKDIEYSNRIIILHNKKISLDTKKEEINNHEKELSKINIKLPMMMELSNKLKMYDIVDKDYINMDEMVDDLCLKQ